MLPLNPDLPRCLGHMPNSPKEWCEHIGVCPHHQTMIVLNEPWEKVTTYFTACSDTKRAELAP